MRKISIFKHKLPKEYFKVSNVEHAEAMQQFTENDFAVNDLV